MSPLDALSPSVLSTVNEHSSQRFLTLIACDNTKVGTYAKLVDDRNESAQPNGSIFYSTEAALDLKITEILQDPQKARANFAKHAIEFADAIGVLEDPYALTMLDPHEREERWLTLGRDYLDRVVVMSWTWASAEAIRPISARRATPKQRRQYAEDAHA